MLQPLELVVSRQDDQVVVEASELGEVGWGATLMLAIADLQRALAELYSSLEADQGRLSDDLSRLWQRLQTFIARRG